MTFFVVEFLRIFVWGLVDFLSDLTMKEYKINTNLQAGHA